MLTPPMSQPTTPSHILGVRVIGVIDLKAGKAVHARGGTREQYAPVQSALLSPGLIGDAPALARAYRDVGIEEIYVADLDRITRAGDSSSAVAAVAEVGLPLLVDAGTSDVREAAAVLEAGAARVVIGLETLSSMHDLRDIIAKVGRARVVFSLDLRGHRTVTRSDGELDQITPVELTTRAVDVGVQSILLLDLSRVGQSRGPDVALVRAIRARASGSELLVGGGIRSADDLTALARAGCNGALVATAVHDGSLIVAGGDPVV